MLPYAIAITVFPDSQEEHKEWEWRRGYLKDAGSDILKEKGLCGKSVQMTLIW